MANRKGMTSDSLYTTEATATPFFWATKATKLKSVIKQTPINMAHGNHTSCRAAITGKLPLKSNHTGDIIEYNGLQVIDLELFNYLECNGKPCGKHDSA